MGFNLMRIDVPKHRERPRGAGCTKGRSQDLLYLELFYFSVKPKSPNFRVFGAILKATYYNILKNPRIWSFYDFSSEIFLIIIFDNNYFLIIGFTLFITSIYSIYRIYSQDLQNLFAGSIGSIHRIYSIYSQDL